jgi:hypothetical protein
VRHFTPPDGASSELQHFFRDASYDAEIAFLLGALSLVDEAIPDGAFETRHIAKMREVRETLLALDQPHADVLSWVFEVRAHNDVLRSHFSWPGVAIRTAAAQFALACEGAQARVVDSASPLPAWATYCGPPGAWSTPERTGRLTSLPTGDFHHRRGEVPYRKPKGVDGIVAYLVGLKANGEAKKAIEDETARRVEAAFRAYERERPKRRARRAA